MNFSYFELKRAVYIMMAVLGAFLLFLAILTFGASATADEPFGYIISSLVLFVGGALCVFFGFTTFIIRDDPDVWR